MTDNITQITKPAPVDAEMIEMLEEMVIEAKEGKLLSVAGVILDASGDNVNFTSVEPTDELKMLGALNILLDSYKLEHLTEYDIED